MTVFEYLTKDLDMSEAQCEAIMQLADVCGMKPMFEAGIGALQRLKQNREALAAKKAEEAAKATADNPDKLDLSNVSADFDKEDVMRTSTEDRANDDYGSLYDSDERVDLSDLFDSHSDWSSAGSKHGTTGVFNTGWQNGDEGNEGFNSDQGDVTREEKKRSETKEDVNDNKFAESNILQFVISLGQLASLKKPDTIKLATACAEQVDANNNANGVGGRSDAGTEIGEVVSEFGGIQTTQFDSLCEKLRSLIERIYSTPNLAKRTKLTNLIEDYVVENSTSPFASVLASAKRDPMETSSVKNDAASLSDAENKAAWDRIVKSYQEDNSNAPFPNQPDNPNRGMSYNDIMKTRKKMWVNQTLKDKLTTTA